LPLISIWVRLLAKLPISIAHREIAWVDLRFPSERIGTIIALGTTQVLAWASSFFLPAVLARAMSRSINVSPDFVYAGLSAALLASAIFGPALGRLVDRSGGRKVLCGSNVIFSIGLILLGESVGPISFIAAWLILGVAMSAGLYEVTFAALARLYGRSARSAIIGTTLIGGFASTVGWPVSTFVEHLYGWRVVCLTWAALHLVGGLPLNWWALRRCPNHSSISAAQKETAPKELEKHSRAELLMTVVFCTSGFVSFGMTANLPRLLLAMGASQAGAIAAASLMGPAQVMARIIELGAQRKINPLVSAKIANALHPLASVAAVAGGSFGIFAFSVVQGIGNGMLTIMRGTLPLAIFGGAGYGARVGRIAVPVRVGQAAAPFLIGFAIEQLGRSALIISSTLSLVALSTLFLLFLPRLKGEHADPF
jgi:MFS family permease